MSEFFFARVKKSILGAENVPGLTTPTITIDLMFSLRGDDFNAAFAGVAYRLIVMNSIAYVHCKQSIHQRFHPSATAE